MIPRSVRYANTNVLGIENQKIVHSCHVVPDSTSVKWYLLIVINHICVSVPPLITVLLIVLHYRRRRREVLL